MQRLYLWGKKLFCIFPKNSPYLSNDPHTYKTFTEYRLGSQVDFRYDPQQSWKYKIYNKLFLIKPNLLEWKSTFQNVQKGTSHYILITH